MTIYFAAPLFTSAEKNFNIQLKDEIKKCRVNYIIKFPQEFSAPLLPDFSKVFDACVSNINDSDVVVAILDGPDADSGTSFELGYAFAKKIPIIGIRTDFRSLEDEGLNLMLSKSVDVLIKNPQLSVKELAQLIIDKLEDIQIR